MRPDDCDELDRAYVTLQGAMPDRVSRAIGWLRAAGRTVRIPIAVLLILGGLLSFLPVLGIWMLPLGLLLIAEDVPFLRKPVGRGMLWMHAKLRAMRAWWQRRSAGSVD